MRKRAAVAPVAGATASSTACKALVSACSTVHGSRVLMGMLLVILLLGISGRETSCSEDHAPSPAVQYTVVPWLTMVPYSPVNRYSYKLSLSPSPHSQQWYEPNADVPAETKMATNGRSSSQARRNVTVVDGSNTPIHVAVDTNGPDMDDSERIAALKHTALAKKSNGRRLHKRNSWWSKKSISYEAPFQQNLVITDSEGRPLDMDGSDQQEIEYQGQNGEYIDFNLDTVLYCYSTRCVPKFVQCFTYASRKQLRVRCKLALHICRMKCHQRLSTPAKQIGV